MDELVTTTADAMRELVCQNIEHAELTLLAHEQAPCPVLHHFGPGVYIREVHLSAGLFAIGHRQTQEHVNIMLKGRVLMLQDDGSTIELVAPMMFTGKPGRKIGYILEDVVWQNIYATQERDIPTLENMFLDKSLGWQEAETLRLQERRLHRGADREDFRVVLAESGFSADTVQAQSENTADQCPMPQGSWKVKLGESPIQGNGVFLTAGACAGEVLGPARLSGFRTPLGRYTNHSVTPNARMELLPNGDIQLVALREIKGCAGGTDGDEVTICYRQALHLSGIVCSNKGEST